MFACGKNWFIVVWTGGAVKTLFTLLVSVVLNIVKLYFDVNSLMFIFLI